MVHYPNNTRYPWLGVDPVVALGWSYVGPAEATHGRRRARRSRDQPEESGNQVNVTCVTADGVNEHVVPELVLSTPVSAGKPGFRNFMAPTLTDFDDMVQAAFTVLPKKYTHLCDAVMIQVKDFPDQETLEKVHSKNKFGVLGTFHKLVRSSRVCLAGADPTGWAGPSSPRLENGERLVAFSHCCRAF